VSVHRIVPSCDRVAVYFGERAEYATAIGTIKGLANGLVQIEIEGGPHFILNSAETKAIGKAILYAGCAADRAGELRSGVNAIRIAKTSTGEVRATYRGDTRALRRLRFRGQRGRDCMACRVRQHVEIYLGAHTAPGHWAEVCGACIDKLAQEPVGLRKVEGESR
jgi:hypothetical protein